MVEKKITYAEVMFTRAEKLKWADDACYYDSALFVFTLNPKFNKNDLLKLLNILEDNQFERWSQSGGEPLSEKTPPTAETEIITEKKYNEITGYLDTFNICVKDITKWDKLDPNWIPPLNFKTVDGIISLLVICGMSGRASNIEFKSLMEIVGFDNPCFKPSSCGGEVMVASEAMHVYVDTNIRIEGLQDFPVCRLKKEGGFISSAFDCRISGDKNMNMSNVQINETKTTTNKKSIEKDKAVSKHWGKIYPNPLKGRTVKVNDDILDTLKFCVKYGLNPIPIRKNNRPFTNRTYLQNEPINDYDLSLFKKDVNIGIVAGYQNLILVDVDEIPFDFNIDTTTVRTGGGGWHYYFFSDKSLNKEYSPNNYNIKRPTHIKSQGYVAAPPSIHPKTGLRYRWVKKIKPMTITADELEKLIDEKMEVLKK